MKGNNTLILNGASLIEALQEYFDKRITSKIKVESVSASTGAYDQGTFTIKVSEIVENG